MTEDEITYKIRGAIFNVYNALGPGLLEVVYEKAMVYELKKKGLKVKEQEPCPVIYDGHDLGLDLRIDLLVEDTVIVELKSVLELKEVFYKQTMTYLKLAHKHVGILVNFNTDNIMESIHRVLNGYK